MARYGKLLLQRLTFQYCDRMSSSHGLRDYLALYAPTLAETHPHVELQTVVKRNRFPLVKAEYALLPNNTTHLERLIAEGESRSQREKRRKIIEQYEAAAMAAATEQGSQLPSPDELRAQAEAAAATALERHNSNVIGLKHMSAEEVRRVVWWLAQSQGRPRTRPAPGKRVVSSQPSIQGMWTATTFGGM